MKAHTTSYALWSPVVDEWVEPYWHSSWGRMTYCSSSYLDDIEQYKSFKTALKKRDEFKKVTNNYPHIYKITIERIM